MSKAPRGLAELERLLWHITLNGDCWEFDNLDKNGYGRATYRGRETEAHRAVWQELVGPCPEGLVADHGMACHNRSCSNPDHLDWVTQGVNASRGRMRTHCSRGHDLSDAYIAKDARGLNRQCRECGRVRKREWARKKANEQRGRSG